MTVTVLLGACEAYDRMEYAKLLMNALDAGIRDERWSQDSVAPTLDGGSDARIVSDDVDQILPDVPDRIALDATDSAVLDVVDGATPDITDSALADTVDVALLDVQCNGGTQVCSGTCVDLNSDPRNCGRCTHSCSAGLVCTGGVCCGADIAARCPGQCVDTEVNPAGCGMCGQSCVDGVGCADGACTVPQVGDVIQLINSKRAAMQRSPLVPDPRLMAAAQWFANDMAVHDYVTTVGIASDGSSVADRLERNGYEPAWSQTCSVWGTTDPVGYIFTNLSQRYDLLSASAQHIGVGYVDQQSDTGNVRYVVQGGTGGPFFYYWVVHVAIEKSQ